jgi:hypothetical protein
MKDREFIELLNLYVDREISAEDAIRLESEVVANPRRREVYDQYCRMQKACSVIAQELASEPASAPGSDVARFPAQAPWGLGPVALGIAAAIVFTVGIASYNYHSSDSYLASQAAPVALAKAAPTPLGLVAETDSMKPVFSTRLPADPVARSSRHPSFASDTLVPQLDWIGEVQMPPVFTSANSELLINPKTDIKASGLVDAQADSQEPVEMAAFRFQR